MTDAVGLMAGKRGLIMGVANDRSIAWGIASVLSRHGAELAFTYQDETFLKRVRPLAESVGSDIVLPCDVSDLRNIWSAFDDFEKKWESIDFVIHAIAYSDREELKGKYLDTTRENFLRTLGISCFSFTSVAKRAVDMMNNGGSLVTLTYFGSKYVVPHYNVMGVAKAALEASVRYLATDLGRDGIRVNAISSGPMRTLAGSGISSARYVYKWSQENAPLRRRLELQEVGTAALYLVSDLSSAVTGEIHHVDCGFNVVGMKLVGGGPAGDGAEGPGDRPATPPAAAGETGPRQVSTGHDETVDQARDVHDKTIRFARDAYEEVVQHARNAYDDVVRHARGAYDEVVRHGHYGEVVERARTGYDEAVKRARKAYDEALRKAREAGEAAIDHIRTIVGEPKFRDNFEVADRKSEYAYEDLLRCAHGELFGPGNARLPLPPLLMFDRIAHISDKGGMHGAGEIVAELDIAEDIWFFDSHFESDPVMPGCFGLDAMWQLLGFYLGWIGAPGNGRALGVGEVKFTGTVLPSAKKITYRVAIKRIIRRQLVLGIADAVMAVDGRDIYEAKNLRVGLFTSTESF